MGIAGPTRWQLAARRGAPWFSARTAGSESKQPCYRSPRASGAWDGLHAYLSSRVPDGFALGPVPTDVASPRARQHGARIRTRVHVHGSQSAPAPASAARLCRRSDSMQTNAPSRSCATSLPPPLTWRRHTATVFPRAPRSAAGTPVPPLPQQARAPHASHALCPYVSACARPVVGPVAGARARQGARPRRGTDGHLMVVGGRASTAVCCRAPLLWTIHQAK